MRRLILCAALAALALPASAQVLTNTSCSSTTATAHVQWPSADNPVWEFDIIRPNRATSTPNGTGLEIRNVYYRGRKVLTVANTPVINVEYDAGGCGCYRDWLDSEVNFVAGNVLPGTTCLAQPNAGTVSSTCDTGNGGTPGSFTGVSFEDYGTELVATSHMQAGWYRYLMKWHFYDDGRIWPEFSFAANSATCTERPHRHHVYWRFDFDLEGTATNDVVTERVGDTVTQTFMAEATRTWENANSDIYWSVRDTDANVGYDIVSSSSDRLLPVDNFSKVDAMVLRYRAGEMSDPGPQGISNCAIRTGDANNESLVDQDVVFWYRAGALHTGGNPFECDIVGPTLNPVGYNTIQTEAPPVAAEGIEVVAAVPNPFMPETTVRFRVAEAQTVRVELYDALGRRVSTLFDGYAQADRYETVRVDGSGLPSGTYVVRVTGERVQGTTRVTLQR